MASNEGLEPESYYCVLGVSKDSSEEEIRRAYRKLAMQWHPDRWAKKPSSMGFAKRKFQKLQEAYSVLSDQKKRTMYDAGFYDPNEEEDEGFADFLEEMMSLMANVREEGRNYSMEDLQGMLWEMTQGSGFFPDWADFSPKRSTNYSTQQCFGSLKGTKKPRWETHPLEGSSHWHIFQQAWR